MAKTETFEELIAWQKARLLANGIYAVTCHEEFARDWGLKDQIRRAAVSVMSNIVEGYERESAKELCHFLNIAKGSCGEVRSQLYIAWDVGYLDESTFVALKDLATETSRIITGFRSFHHSRISTNPLKP